MKDDNFKRFVKGSILFVIFLFCALLFWVSLELRQLKSQVALNTSIIGSQPVQPIRVVNGRDGAPGLSIQGPVGLQGLQGTSGKDGQNATADQIAAAVAAYLASHPVVGLTGPKGDSGQDGKTLEIQLDTKSCLLEEKYSTDDFWQPIAQLSFPCDPNSDTQNVQPAS